MRARRSAAGSPLAGGGGRRSLTARMSAAVIVLVPTWTTAVARFTSPEIVEEPAAATEHGISPGIAPAAARTSSVYCTASPGLGARLRLLRLNAGRGLRSREPHGAPR